MDFVQLLENAKQSNQVAISKLKRAISVNSRAFWKEFTNNIKEGTGFWLDKSSDAYDRLLEELQKSDDWYSEQIAFEIQQADPNIAKIKFYLAMQGMLNLDDAYHDMLKFMDEEADYAAEWYEHQMNLEHSKQNPNFAKIYAMAVGQGMLDIYRREELRSALLFCITLSANPSGQAKWLTKVTGKQNGLKLAVDMRTKFGIGMKQAAFAVQQFVTNYGVDQGFKKLGEEFGDDLAKEMKLLWDIADETG